MVKHLVVFITVVHTYLYIVVVTQLGCHNLKLDIYIFILITKYFSVKFEKGVIVRTLGTCIGQ